MTDSTGIIEAWKQAYLARDPDALAALYEEDALFVMPSIDLVARGREAIREAWVGLIAWGRADSVQIVERDEQIIGDVAYAHQHGVIRGEVDGQPVEIPFRTTEVMRRGGDGEWRYVIDHA